MIRVLLVDDHPIVREGLAAVLGDEPDITVVGTTGRIAEAAAAVREARPDVVLLDLTLPDGSGADLVPVLLAEHPALRILIFTAYDADERILSALRAGARGYLLKGASGAEVARAVRMVQRGEPYVAPDAAATLIAALGAPVAAPSASPAYSSLSEREREVLRLVVAGLPNKQIARQLGITERTIKFHLSSLLRKLDASSRAQAAALAVQHGLV